MSFGSPGHSTGPKYSDKRLKENIVLVGKSKSGINIYEFNFIDNKYGEGRHRGVIAQELSYATSTGADGYLMVDYDEIDVSFEKIN